MSALLALAGRALADDTSPSDRGRADGDVDGDVYLDREVGADLTIDLRRLVEVDDADDLVLDDEAARGPLDAGAAFIEDSLAASSGLIDATSLHDFEARQHRPSRGGRLDLGVAWRVIDKDSEPNEPSRRHEVLLVATWRK